MATFISTRETQFFYFDQQLDGPIWKGGKVLDFGGNVGGFLVSAEDRVDHDDYWCLDLNAGAIEQGRRNFPRAHFHHYNRYSSQYNPCGVRNLPVPDLGVKFDIMRTSFFLSRRTLIPRHASGLAPHRPEGSQGRDVRRHALRHR